MVPADRICGELPTTKQAYRNNIAIAWPSALEYFLVALISAVDTVMVGTLGHQAITAVGLTTQPRFIVLAVITALNVGVTAVVARRRGQDDLESANRCLRQGILLSAVISLVVGAVAFIFAPQLLSFAGAKPDVIADTVLYFRIILLGNFFLSLSLTINAAQRGVGNTKVSMRTNLIANFINLIFNYLLISGNFGFPRLGVAGAGVATVLGNIVACAMSFYSVFGHNEYLRLGLSTSWKFDKKTLGAILKVAKGALAEQLILRVGFFSYAKIVAELGTMAFAAHQIAMNALIISFSFGDGLGVASSSLIGQNLGANRPDLALMYGKIGQRIGFLISGVLCVIFVSLHAPIISAFDSSPEMLALSSPLMIIAGFACIGQVSAAIYAGCLRGAGDVNFVAIMSLITIGGIRPIMSWALCYPLGLGLLGAWIALIIDQYMRLTLCSLRFSGGKWAKIQV